MGNLLKLFDHLVYFHAAIHALTTMRSEIPAQQFVKLVRLWRHDAGPLGPFIKIDAEWAGLIARIFAAC